MRLSLRFAAAAVTVLVITNFSSAQVGGGFHQRQGIAFQVRTGPNSSFTYVAGSYGFGFGPIYGPLPPWYYGQPGVPIVNNPFTVQPPVVINNVVQVPPAAPPAAAPPPNRGPQVPAEFDPAPAPGANPKPAAKPGRAAGPQKPAALMPDPPKAVKLPGRAEADRAVETARKSFSEGQYGRAAELFARAADMTPNEPSALWLLSQAEFALGKYREAVDAIAAGMALRPDWSEARFNSRDLYWKKPELFDDHLKALRDAVASFPDDPILLFLLGHELWFDGKADEAKALMLKAKQLGNGKTPAEKFLTK
jgi:hypothetical protein